MGVKPTEVDRVVLFLLRSEKDGTLSEPVLVVTTASNAPRDKILAALLPPQPRQHTEGDTIYYTKGEPHQSAEIAVHFANNRTFLLAPPAEVRRILRRRSQSDTSGSWTSVFKPGTEKHLIVAGLYPPEFLQKWIGDEFLKEEPSLRPLLSRAARR